MEHFAQMNVFARIRTVFARIRTVFAYLIIGCAIRYPKIGCLRYITKHYTTQHIVHLYMYMNMCMISNSTLLLINYQ